MKLKKLLALALAGVMAVSMLAGCKDNGNSNSGDDEGNQTTGVTAQAVIDALGKDITSNVTFTADGELQAVVDEASRYVSDGIVNTFDKDLLDRVNDAIAKNAAYLPTAGVSSVGPTDASVQTATFVVGPSTKYVSASAAAKSLAAILNRGYGVDSYNIKLENLPKETAVQNDPVADYKYTFVYAADAAVASIVDADGAVEYYFVFTLTRTPTRVAV